MIIRAHVIRFVFLAALVAFFLRQVSAQTAPTTGTPPFSTVAGSPDAVNVANLNVHVPIPILHKAGRGLDFTYDYSNDSSVWYQILISGTPTWQPVYNLGWRAQTEAATGYASYQGATITNCSSGGQKTGTEVSYTGWIYHDQFGIPHPVTGTSQTLSGTCPNFQPSFVNTATDGSGISVHVIGDTFASGTETVGYAKTVPIGSGVGAASGQDRNGNQITVDGGGSFTDTLGTIALTVTGTPTQSSNTLLHRALRFVGSLSAELHELHSSHQLRPFHRPRIQIDRCSTPGDQPRAPRQFPIYVRV